MVLSHDAAHKPTYERMSFCWHQLISIENAFHAGLFCFCFLFFVFVLYINAYVNNSHNKRQGSERPIKGSQLLKKLFTNKKQSQED